MRFLLVTLLLLFLAACESTSEPDSPSTFWESKGDVVSGAQGLVLGAERDFPELVHSSAAIVAVNISGIESTTLPQPVPDDVAVGEPETQLMIEEMARVRDSTPMTTTYRGTVSDWILGDGPPELLITGFGGVGAEGNEFFIDGSFLLESGRRYLLFLTEDGGDYYYHTARTSFDLTSGVYVLNHPDTRDLEDFENFSPSEFINHVGEVVREVANEPRCPFTVGDRVQNDQYGEGLVLTCKPVAGDFQLTVSFNTDAGFQKFLLSSTPLKTVSR